MITWSCPWCGFVVSSVPTDLPPVVFERHLDRHQITFPSFNGQPRDGLGITVS